MAVETELKLRITLEQLAKPKRHPLLKAYQLTRPVTRRLYNIYLDTPKLELHQSGMALRLRRSGRQWLQTLKGGGSVQGGLHQRNEWEMPVSGPALDFSLPLVEAWKEVLPKHLRTCHGVSSVVCHGVSSNIPTFSLTSTRIFAQEYVFPMITSGGDMVKRARKFKSEWSGYFGMVA